MNQEIHAELQRAHETVRAAQQLVSSGFIVDAISRAYYAVLHAAQAALLQRNIRAGSHRALRALFGQHLVKTGLIEKEFAVILRKEAEDRELSDYQADVTLSAEVAAQRVREAEQFVARIEQWLKEQFST